MTEKRLLGNEDWSPPMVEDGTRLALAADRLRLAEADLSDADLAERHRWLEMVIDQIPDYIFAKDLDGRFLFANRVTVHDNGLAHLGELVGKTDFDLHPYDIAASIAETERRVIAAGVPDLGIEEQSIGLQRDRWLMMSRIPLKDRSGQTIGVLGISRDITARKSAEHLMQMQAQLLEMIAQGIALNHFLGQLATMIEARLPGLKSALTVRSADGVHLNLVAAPSLSADFRQTIARMEVAADGMACGQAAYFGEAVIAEDVETDPRWERHRNLARKEGFQACWSIPIQSYLGAAIGTLTLFAATPLAPAAEHHELIAIAVHLARIAIERRQAEERITFLASHDALTGLPNRMLMDEELARLVAEAKLSGDHLVVAFLDLDNFKLVNDSLGHAAGDDLLKIAARRIAHLVNDDGMVIRVGGDEFIVLLRAGETEGPYYLSRLQAIRTALAEPITLEGMDIQISCSMGIACYPQHGASPTDLLANADAAMYHAKETGRDRLQVFSAEMAEKTRQKLARIEDFRRALRQNEFVLHYQPQMNQCSGRVFGAEALVRWQHPADGLIAPSHFIPLAEDSGLVVPLGDWVLREACRQAKAWQDEGLPPVVISVNVSARQFREAAWVGTVASALAQSGLQAEWLELELTESLIMEDLSGAIARMGELAALGVKLAIDDFGTGYSSLSALKRFPVSRLKIDRSFVTDIPHDADDMAITSAIVSLAQKLGLAVIAEGVETEAQAAFLRACGCTDIQGFLFSKPLDPLDFRGLLRRSLRPCLAIATAS